ncbi:hypothetical protein AK812_SmicGene3195 [Symbiodinium microadriaticum]|uniref:Uncharacterized protein n=1 Tax=Symbiodinium microadriaticum TaxID=2951 RepID=A0A1Q9EZM5_SYMMI|nr:hypothetical protein AK812_SmicGene3195 [Symbiodinium microadriaticum]
MAFPVQPPATSMSTGLNIHDLWRLLEHLDDEDSSALAWLLLAHIRKLRTSLPAMHMVALVWAYWEHLDRLCQAWVLTQPTEEDMEMVRDIVALYPILQNFTSIPVLAIFIRYNLQASGLSRGLATFVAFGVPWLLSIPFYTGRGLDAIAETGGLATSSVINFLVPSVAALRAWLAMPREKICEI